MRLGKTLLTGAAAMKHFRLLILLLGVVALSPADGKTLSYPAENQVPVTLVRVVRSANHTEIRLQPQSALRSVCWHYSGPESPYLVSGTHRYRFLSGDHVTACPTRRDYAAGDIMVLRFAPLGSAVAEFSLVEGKGGEAQMNSAEISGEWFWNFLHVRPR